MTGKLLTAGDHVLLASQEGDPFEVYRVTSHELIDYVYVSIANVAPSSFANAFDDLENFFQPLPTNHLYQVRVGCRPSWVTWQLWNPPGSERLLVDRIAPQQRFNDGMCPWEAWNSSLQLYLWRTVYPVLRAVNNHAVDTITPQLRFVGHKLRIERETDQEVLSDIAKYRRPITWVPKGGVGRD